MILAPNGIRIDGNSDENLFHGNTITGCNTGIYIPSGATQNIIGINNFYNNSTDITDNRTNTIKAMVQKTLNATERSSSNTSYTKLKEISLQVGGKFTFYWQMRAEGGTVYTKLYVNGTAIGTEQSTTSTTYVNKSDTITVQAEDLVQIYGHGEVGYAVFVKNFYVKQLGCINFNS